MVHVPGDCERLLQPKGTSFTFIQKKDDANYILYHPFKYINIPLYVLYISGAEMHLIITLWCAEDQVEVELLLYR